MTTPDTYKEVVRDFIYSLDADRSVFCLLLSKIQEGHRLSLTRVFHDRDIMDMVKNRHPSAYQLWSISADSFYELLDMVFFCKLKSEVDTLYFDRKRNLKHLPEAWAFGLANIGLSWNSKDEMSDIIRGYLRSKRINYEEKFTFFAHTCMFTIKLSDD